ncbi:GBF-interacting protein 1-like [Senna tora]|uniref:GBF-interacting protein 1-like n=1 Tax=Senna tora TaxID=362788 RepID=A0A834WRB5_9FABA|nr:GBF-interacting protein 1-like [Senna tora]
MSGGGGSRVPIPNNVRRTIQDIREITGKQHADDEIYAVLKECSMDPNETAQKLLYLDTFHEVRRRRDRKKEGLASRVPEDSRSKQAGQGRRGRGASGGNAYSSNFPDGAGGRNPAIRRENGVNHIVERGQAPSTRPVLQKTKNLEASQVIRVSTVASNGPANQSNGSFGGSVDQSHTDSVTSVSNKIIVNNDNSKQENDLPQAAVVAASSPTQTFTKVVQGKSVSSSDLFATSSSASDAVVFSSSVVPAVQQSMPLNLCFGNTSDINEEVGSQWIASGVNPVKGDKVVLSEVGDSLTSKSQKSESLNTSKTITPNKSSEIKKNQLSETSQPSSSTYNGSLMSSSSCSSQPPSVNVSDVSSSEVCVPSSAGLKQFVTFPNHFQVPEAFKNGLTFGSFDSNSGQKERSISGTGGDNKALLTLESSIGSDDTTTSSNQSVSTAHRDHPDYSQTLSYQIEKKPSPEGNAVSGANSIGDQPKQEVLLTSEGPPSPTVQNGQNYLNFMPTMLGNQQFQLEGAEPQVQETSRLPNFGADSQAASSSGPTPPLQNSIPVPPQSVSIFRPPYPTNFFPYGHYYPPIYLSPMHQFLNHNGFPQQPSAGNLYLPAAPGIKFPLSQFKAGANTGNMAAHIGIPSGSFISPPVGYAPSPTVNSVSSSGNEDLAVSQLKENHIYSSGQLSEGSAVWIPSPGQDISSMQLNSLYNLTPQGQHHLAFSQTQAGRGAFAGIYQPGQTVASHSTLLQQSQAVASVETAGTPSGAFQLPQNAQINWNSNF